MKQKNEKREKCRCGRESIIFRKYEGRHLCKYHFCESIEEKIKKTIGKSGMIQRRDKIAFALSGGLNSTIALHVMSKILKPRKDIDFFAISIDEGIKGYRSKSLETVKKMCKKQAIKYYVFSFKEFFNKTLDEKVKELKKQKTGITEICTYCGVAKRYLLNKKARELEATKLCMGHNLDDEIQAIIMNYIRGDLLRASRMGPVTDYSIKISSGKKKSLFIPRIRPLREVPESELNLYAKIKKISKHASECPYANGLRFDTKNFVNDLENKYPGIKFSILKTFDKLLLGIRKTIKKDTEMLVCKKCSEPSSSEICNTCKLWL